MDACLSVDTFVRLWNPHSSRVKRILYLGIDIFTKIFRYKFEKVPLAFIHLHGYAYVDLGPQKVPGYASTTFCFANLKILGL